MGLVNAPVFGKVLGWLGIRETVALTSVDFSRAIPTVPMQGPIFAERATYRVFMATHVAIGAETNDADPRDPSDWSNVIINGVVADPSATPGLVVPSGHDFLILGIGVSLSASVRTIYVRENDTGVFTAAQTLYHADASAGGFSSDTDGSMVQNYPGALFFPQADTSDCKFFIAGAVTANLVVSVVSAPEGAIHPHA